MYKERTAPAKPKQVSGINAERATEIQTALIKAGYLSGSPSGAWDASTQAALEKLQAQNGWQTKMVPDARALIRLGLGPGSQNSMAASHESSDPHGVNSHEELPATAAASQ